MKFWGICVVLRADAGVIAHPTNAVAEGWLLAGGLLTLGCPAPTLCGATAMSSSSAARKSRPSSLASGRWRPITGPDPPIAVQTRLALLHDAAVSSRRASSRSVAHILHTALNLLGFEQGRPCLPSAWLIRGTAGS
eukprot:3275352-Rhodomonas_salina.2